MTHEALSKITIFVCGSFPLELGFRNRGSRKIGSLFFNAPHMSMGDPQNCCWQPRANKQYSLFASQQPTWKLWTLNPKPYSSYIISHCCSPASCMIGLTKWVHLCAHKSTQCGLQNPLLCKWFHSCANDFTSAYTNPAQSASQHGSHFVKAIGAMGTQYCTKWAPAGSHFVESCWTHDGYTILHKVDSCSPHFVQVIGPMASPCSSH